ncbi:hypothetical protein C8J57DRAFT_1211946 [Mycena rebaudengoi]|nr:hypothetical protein C8J57DRAFT_1211946 [Mycena rebaudengoi]
MSSKNRKELHEYRIEHRRDRWVKTGDIDQIREPTLVVCGLKILQIQESGWLPDGVSDFLRIALAGWTPSSPVRRGGQAASTSRTTQNTTYTPALPLNLNLFASYCHTLGHLHQLLIQDPHNRYIVSTPSFSSIPHPAQPLSTASPAPAASPRRSPRARSSPATFTASALVAGDVHLEAHVVLVHNAGGNDEVRILAKRATLPRVRRRAALPPALVPYFAVQPPSRAPPWCGWAWSRGRTKASRGRAWGARAAGAPMSAEKRGSCGGAGGSRVGTRRSPPRRIRRRDLSALRATDVELIPLDERMVVPPPPSAWNANWCKRWIVQGVRESVESSAFASQLQGEYMSAAAHSENNAYAPPSRRPAPPRPLLLTTARQSYGFTAKTRTVRLSGTAPSARLNGRATDLLCLRTPHARARRAGRACVAQSVGEYGRGRRGLCGSMRTARPQEAWTVVARGTRTGGRNAQTGAGGVSRGRPHPGLRNPVNPLDLFFLCSILSRRRHIFIHNTCNILFCGLTYWFTGQADPRPTDIQTSGALAKTASSF